MLSGRRIASELPSLNETIGQTKSVFDADRRMTWSSAEKLVLPRRLKVRLSPAVTSAEEGTTMFVATTFTSGLSGLSEPEPPQPIIRIKAADRMANNALTVNFFFI